MLNFTYIYPLTWMHWRQYIRDASMPFSRFDVDQSRDSGLCQWLFWAPLDTKPVNKAYLKDTTSHHSFCLNGHVTGLILGLRPANERRRYKVTRSLIGWAQT